MGEKTTVLIKVSGEEKPQTPKLRQMCREWVSHLGAHVDIVSYISPDRIRRPGAMPLNVLQRDIMIKSKGGTWTSEGVKCYEWRVFTQIY